MPLLATLFPAEVAAAETRQPGDAALLFPEEAEHVAKAIAKRAGEFAAGRLCARQALRSLGVEGFPLKMGEDRRPLWPPGIVGSTTHTHGFYGVVAAREAQCRSIGVDAEVIGRVGRHLWPKICSPGETIWLESLPEAEQLRLGALIFSAKEAFYKCQYGLTRAWVGFHDVELDPAACDLHGGHFTVRPLLPLELERRLPQPWSGRCRFEPDLVLSGMIVPS
jgi:4'-phosphopantetheinyl transferase EntD